MESALIGLVGLLIGLLINEYYRRNSRIEKYSTVVFEKRLAIYQGLMKEIQLASSVISEVVKNTEMAHDEKNEILFHNGLKVAEYTDEHKFYLNEEIAIHCMLLFVGSSDVLDEENGKERLKEVMNGVTDAYKMIRTEAGVAELDSLFKSITKSKPGGQLIERFREIKKEHEKKA